MIALSLKISKKGPGTGENLKLLAEVPWALPAKFKRLQFTNSSKCEERIF